MENAAKALLMAAGILIALLIIGALVLMFSQLSDYQNKEDMSAKQSQIAAFNSQYEPYNKDDLTIMELISVYNKINNNNDKHVIGKDASGKPIVDQDYYIECNFKNSNIKNDMEKYKNKASYSDQLDEEKALSKLRYKCTKVKYTSSKNSKSDFGRICYMEFDNKN